MLCIPKCKSTIFTLQLQIMLLAGLLSSTKRKTIFHSNRRELELQYSSGATSHSSSSSLDCTALLGLVTSIVEPLLGLLGADLQAARKRPFFPNLSTFPPTLQPVSPSLSSSSISKSLAKGLSARNIGALLVSWSLQSRCGASFSWTAAGKRRGREVSPMCSTQGQELLEDLVNEKILSHIQSDFVLIYSKDILPSPFHTRRSTGWTQASTVTWTPINDRLELVPIVTPRSFGSLVEVIRAGEPNPLGWFAGAPQKSCPHQRLVLEWASRCQRIQVTATATWMQQIVASFGETSSTSQTLAVSLVPHRRLFTDQPVGQSFTLTLHRY